jgi:hypothetical protein
MLLLFLRRWFRLSSVEQLSLLPSFQSIISPSSFGNIASHYICIRRLQGLRLLLYCYLAGVGFMIGDLVCVDLEYDLLIGLFLHWQVIIAKNLINIIYQGN